jgi:hypothetical protein
MGTRGSPNELCILKLDPQSRSSISNLWTSWSLLERGERDLISMQPCKVELPSHKFGSYILCDPNLWCDRVEGSPLAQRGWVVQERFLAPRTLHFTSEQFFWQCRELKACDTFPDGILEPSLSVMFPTTPRNGGRDPKFHGSPSEVWRRVVVNYTSAKLTKEQDKLIALSGIAMRLHLHTKVQYLAGLWERNIERQLLWRPSREDKRRPTKYRAPSWSWASMEGPIILPSETEPNGIWIKVLGVDIQPVTPNEYFGQIQSGSLKIQCGQLRTTWVEYSDSYKTQKLFIETKNGPSVLYYSTPDVEGLQTTNQLSLLLVENRDKERSSGPWAFP